MYLAPEPPGNFDNLMSVKATSGSRRGVLKLIQGVNYKEHRAGTLKEFRSKVEESNVVLRLVPERERLHSVRGGLLASPCSPQRQRAGMVG